MEQNTQDIKTAENSLFRWAISILIAILFAFTGIIYGYLKNADAAIDVDVAQLKKDNIESDRRFQNLEANVYLLCKSQKLDCIPPIK